MTHPPIGPPLNGASTHLSFGKLLPRILIHCKTPWHTLWIAAALVFTLLCISRALDIYVPQYAGKIFDAMGNKVPLFEGGITLIMIAGTIWLIHGTILPFILESFDQRFFLMRLREKTWFECADMVTARDTFVTWKLRSHTNKPSDFQACTQAGEEAIAELVPFMLRTIPGIIGATAALIVLWFQVPLICYTVVAFSAIEFVIMALSNRPLAHRFKQRQGMLNHARAGHIEYFSRLLEWYAAGNEARIEALETFTKRWRIYLRFHVRTEILFQCITSLRKIVLLGANIAIWSIGYWYVSEQEKTFITVGTIVGLIPVSSQALGLVALCADIHRKWLDYQAPIRLMFELLDEPTDLKLAKPQHIKLRRQKKRSYRNVISFSAKALPSAVNSNTKNAEVLLIASGTTAEAALEAAE